MLSYLGFLTLYVVGTLVLVGLGYFIFKKFVRGKVVVQIMRLDKTIGRYALRPVDVGLLKVKGDKTAYLFDQNWVIMGQWMGVPTPHLFFVEGKPKPQNPWERGPNPEDTSPDAVEGSRISSSTLFDVVNGQIVREYVTKSSSGSIPKLQQMMLICFAVLGVIIIGAAWYLVDSGILNGGP